ncbi:MAG TPA: hypothetical protein VGN34_06935 [Ktedonobacteraceae bacterium]
MRKFSHRYLIFAFLLVTITAGTAFGVQYALAAAEMQSIAAQSSISPGTRFSSQELSLHTTNMQHVAPLSDTDAQQDTPLLKPHISTGADLDTQLLQEAAKNQNIPVSRSSYADPVVTKQPTVEKHFSGLAQTCCQPSDVALATSSQWVVEAVNLQVAIYNTNGKLQTGWPKSLAHFFGIPTPSCAKAPFVTAPRASYDANEQRFWVVALEDEGLTNTCPTKSLLWVAVSQTNNPNGNWHIYTFNMASSTTSVARFTQFALDQQAIYFSANMYSKSGKGPFQYSELFASLKAPLQAGRSNITYYGFVGQTVNKQPVDTVQPVQVQENKSAWLHGGLFVNSFNLHYGGGHCVQTCSGIIIWSLTHPGQANDVLTGTIVPSLKYALAPLANQPGCTHCFARKSPPDTRISATPIYHHGLLSFALVTAVNNQKNIVPGILWGQIAPVLNDNGTIASATMYQNGYFHFANDEAALFPSVAVNNAGDLFLLYDYTGSKLKPGTAVAIRRVTYKRGRFHDGGVSVRTGDMPTVNLYWGNYTATSYAGSGTDQVWFAGQFSNKHRNWATYLFSLFFQAR